MKALPTSYFFFKVICRNDFIAQNDEKYVYQRFFGDIQLNFPPVSTLFLSGRRHPVVRLADHRQGSTPPELIDKVEVKKLLQIVLKSSSEQALGNRSSLHELQMRVKIPMGLERFEVGIPVMPIFNSVGIYYGIGFDVKLTFAVFSGLGADLYQNWLITIEHLHIGYQLTK